MTKSYKNLQAKLQELQSILDEALLLDPEAQSHDSISNDIKHKLAFIGNLLTAEIACQSNPSKPHNQLHHISDKLSIMERDFHHWNSFRSLPPCHDFDEDHDSTCSCTDSCLNNDHETDLIAFEDPPELFPDSNYEKAMVEYIGDVADDATGYAEEEMTNGFDKLASFEYEDAEDFLEDKELVEFDDGASLKKTEEEEDNDLEREESGNRNTFGERCCALAGGVVIGMILMGFIMVNTSACFHFVEEVSFAVPT